ncbi:mitochondrial glycine transporter-like [Styela clava]
MDSILASPLVKSFLAGSLSGTCSTLLFQPLDLVKTRLQSAAVASSLAGSQKLGMMQTMNCIVRNDRVIGLWKGFQPSIYRCVPGVGMYFSSLHALKSHFFRDASPTAYQSLLLGATARTITATILIPFTVVKTRIESGNFKYTGVGNALHSIYTLEGRHGLVSGLSATLIRDAPFSGLYLMFYNKGKSIMTENGNGSCTMHFICGIGAGVCASVLTQPADVIKTQMQVSENKNSLKRTVIKVYNVEGLRGFFRGLTPRVLRRTLIAAMAWTVYEEIMRCLHLKT